VLSPHYSDQAALFNSGKFRRQMMNRDEIMASRTAELILLPK
jgi:penicillin amidase